MGIPNTVLGIKVHTESNVLDENSCRVHRNQVKYMRSARYFMRNSIIENRNIIQSDNKVGLQNNSLWENYNQSYEYLTMKEYNTGNVLDGIIVKEVNQVSHFAVTSTLTQMADLSWSIKKDEGGPRKICQWK